MAQQAGRLQGFKQCNKCSYVEAFQPTDVTTEQIGQAGKQTIMRIKEHFEAQGWRTSGGRIQKMLYL